MIEFSVEQLVGHYIDIVVYNISSTGKISNNACHIARLFNIIMLHFTDHLISCQLDGLGYSNTILCILMQKPTL